MNYTKHRKTRESTKAVAVAPISSNLQEQARISPAARSPVTRGKQRPLSPGMAASHHHLSSSLAGMPTILDPSATTSHSPGSLTQHSRDVADIRTLLHALPKRADMEALVLRVEEQHPWDFQQLHGRLAKGESAVSTLEQRVARLEQTHTSHQYDLAEMQLHLEDLENQSRRNNLRLRGLPEAMGPENLQETVRAILHKILDFDPPVTREFYRVHRALWPKPTDPGRPRNVICRFHRCVLKEPVLRASWAKEQIEFGGAEISIFPDVPNDTATESDAETLIRDLAPLRAPLPLGIPLPAAYPQEQQLLATSQTSWTCLPSWGSRQSH